MKVLVDTSAWIYLFAKNQGGEESEIFKEWFRKSNNTLYVTELIIEETHKWLCHHGHSSELSANILSEFVQEKFAIIAPSLKEDRIKAAQLVKKYSDQKLSYTDGSSVAIMERLNIQYICSADRHFDLFPKITRLPNSTGVGPRD